MAQDYPRTTEEILGSTAYLSRVGPLLEGMKPGTYWVQKGMDDEGDNWANYFQIQQTPRHDGQSSYLYIPDPCVLVGSRGIRTDNSNYHKWTIRPEVTWTETTEDIFNFYRNLARG